MAFSGILRSYQKDGLRQVIKNRSNLVSWDLGLGKTILSLAYCEGIKLDNKDGVLVLTPSAIVYQWQEEIKKFTDSNYVIVSGSKTKRSKQWQTPAYYHITNYEKLRTDSEIFNRQWGVVIIDECTKIKNSKAQLTQKAYQIRARKKIGLSGTPIHNTPQDLYSIVNFLYPNLLGSWWQFTNRYIEFEQREMGGRSFNEIIGYKNLDELHQKIQMFFLRKKKEEVLTELPQVTYETLTCAMNPNQEAVYEQICEEIVLTRDTDTILHLLTGLKLLSDHPSLLHQTAGTRLRHFASQVTNTSSHKLNVLLDFVTEHQNQKIVIFSEYVAMLKLIAAHLPVPYVLFHGQQSKEENNSALHRFREDGDIKVLLSSKSGSYGVNLQNASVMVNYDLPYSVADYFQRVGRLHRMGQKSNIVVVNIVTNSTIERKILRILHEKQSMIDQIIDGKRADNIFSDILMEVRR